MLLLALLALAACSVEAPEESGRADASAPASDRPSTDAGASASAGPSTDRPSGPLALDAWFTVVVDGVRLREQPSESSPERGVLPAGTEGLVIGDPVEAGGYTWLPVTGRQDPAAHPCGAEPEDDGQPGTVTGGLNLACGVWSGWVAAGEPGGEAWIERSEPECPDAPATVAALAEIPRSLALYCHGDEPITLEAFVSPQWLGRGCGTSTSEMEPPWLHPCAIVFIQHEQTEFEADGPEAAVHLDPSLGRCGFGGVTDAGGCPWPDLRGEWIVLEGTFDHPDAASCAFVEGSVDAAQDPALTAYFCRSHFVVTWLRLRD